MKRELLAFAATAGVTCALAPAVRRLMLKVGTIDVPNHRSSHTTPVPRGGGVAAIGGAASALLITRCRPRVGFLLPVAGLAVVGYLDDHRSARGGLPAASRLGAQLLAGSLLTKEPIDRGIAAVLTPSVVNIVNFMDGINGISALTALVWGVNTQAATSADARLLGALAAGAGLGFLPWNVPTARLFLGDSGSYLLGGLMAAGIVRAHADDQLLAAVCLAAPLMPYTADAAQAIARRRAAGASLTEAHREHVYQRIVDSGALTHSQMATLHALFATACALAWRRLPAHVAVPTTAAICSGYLAMPKLLKGTV